MTRVHWLLAGLAAVLLVVLFWLLLWSPMSEELDEVRADTERIEADQRQTASRIAALEAVRDEAPQQEALLAASNAVLPRESALPSFLRQVQQAADESGLTLQSVSPARPTPVEEGPGNDGLHRINVTMQLEGGYFQVVDFLRRLEDPQITPRAMLWNALSVDGDPAEHPTLQISVQGDIFAVLPATPPEGEQPDDEDDEDDDADVEVEVEENDDA
jgi:Tfp pilus assembly protein PilO